MQQNTENYNQKPEKLVRILLRKLKHKVKISQKELPVVLSFNSTCETNTILGISLITAMRSSNRKSNSVYSKSAM